MDRRIDKTAVIEAPLSEVWRAWTTTEGVQSFFAPSAWVELVHLGWGEGEEWDATLAYFESAWSVMLSRLVERYRSGPIDWSSL